MPRHRTFVLFLLLLHSMAAKKAIVLDNGGHYLRVGWAGDPKPTKYGDYLFCELFLILFISRVLYNFSAKGKSDRRNWIGDEVRLRSNANLRALTGFDRLIAVSILHHLYFVGP